MLVEIDKRLRLDALKLLRQLVYTTLPPSLGELVDATIIDLAADRSIEVDKRPGLDDILEILSGLVTIVRGREDRDDLEDVIEARGNELKSEDDKIKVISRRR